MSSFAPRGCRLSIYASAFYQVRALREQAEERESGLTAEREENARLRDGLGTYQKEVERLTSENKILKRAVGIQNSKGKEVSLIVPFGVSSPRHAHHLGVGSIDDVLEHCY